MSKEIRKTSIREASENARDRYSKPGDPKKLEALHENAKKESEAHKLQNGGKKPIKVDKDNNANKIIDDFVNKFTERMNRLKQQKGDRMHTEQSMLQDVVTKPLDKGLTTGEHSWVVDQMNLLTGQSQIKNDQIVYMMDPNESSGSYREDDPGLHKGMNPDQNGNSAESSNPPNHPQETHYPIGTESNIRPSISTRNTNYSNLTDLLKDDYTPLDDVARRLGLEFSLPSTDQTLSKTQFSTPYQTAEKNLPPEGSTQTNSHIQASDPSKKSNRGDSSIKPHQPKRQRRYRAQHYPGMQIFTSTNLTETTASKSVWENMTDKDKQSFAQKRSDIWKNMTDEEKATIGQKISDTWKNRTDKDKQDLSRKRSDIWKNKTDEEKATIGQKMSDTWKNRTDKDKQDLSRKRSDIWKNKTDEEKATIGQKMSDTWKNKTDEEKATIGQKISDIWKNKTDEEKATIGQKISDAWKNKTDEEKAVIRQKISDTRERQQQRYNQAIDTLTNQIAQAETDQQAHNLKQKRNTLQIEWETLQQNTQQLNNLVQTQDTLNEQLSSQQKDSLTFTHIQQYINNLDSQIEEYIKINHDSEIDSLLNYFEATYSGS
jgi:hypothetical protein